MNTIWYKLSAGSPKRKKYLKVVNAPQIHKIRQVLSFLYNLCSKTSMHVSYYFDYCRKLTVADPGGGYGGCSPPSAKLSND